MSIVQVPSPICALEIVTLSVILPAFNALEYIKHLEHSLVHSKHSWAFWTSMLQWDVYTFGLPRNFNFQSYMHLVWNLERYEYTFDILLDLREKSLYWKYLS